MLSIIAKQVFNEIQSQLHSNKSSIETLPSAIQREIESALNKAGFVSKQEFDAQTGTLERAQQKLLQLEEQLKALEQAINQ